MHGKSIPDSSETGNIKAADSHSTVIGPASNTFAWAARGRENAA